jgi:hypothetical protein
VRVCSIAAAPIAPIAVWPALTQRPVAGDVALARLLGSARLGGDAVAAVARPDHEVALATRFVACFARREPRPRGVMHPDRAARAKLIGRSLTP